MTKEVRFDLISEFFLEPRMVFVYLTERVEANPKVGLTQQELSRQVGLSLSAIDKSLKWLSDNAVIKITKATKHHYIRLLEPYHEEVRIAFTYENTDDKRIAVLEREVLRQASELKSGKSLSRYLKGERAEVISEIERYTGNLSEVDCYMLGQAMALVGPERLKKAWRTKAHEMKDPVRGITAMLINKAFGNTFTGKEERASVVYRKFRREDA